METPLFSLYGFDWRVGRHWGIAHPDHICYNSADTIMVDNNMIHLGIKHEPKEIVVDGIPQLYPYSVGYVSSINTIKYGHLTVDFKLPIGMHLWPAIWLTDVKTWPPELDIMEAWSGEYEWCSSSPKSPSRIYRVNWLANKIYPGVVLGTCVDEKHGKSYRVFRGSPACYLKTDKTNRCELDWTEDRIQVWYNGHRVVNESDPEVLKYFNGSEGMEIHLNNYVTNSFRNEDLKEMGDKQSKGYTSDFQILNLVYKKN